MLNPKVARESQYVEHQQLERRGSLDPSVLRAQGK
jgi:hypothetical protein